MHTQIRTRSPGRVLRSFSNHKYFKSQRKLSKEDKPEANKTKQKKKKQKQKKLKTNNYNKITKWLQVNN